MYRRLPIPDYEGLYEIDTEGNVYSLDRPISYEGKIKNRKGLKLKCRTDPRGYIMINLWKETKCTTRRVHRLMGYTFLGLPDNMQINHIDGDKANNHLDNLEVCTKTENYLHAIKMGLLAHCPVTGDFLKCQK